MMRIKLITSLIFFNIICIIQCHIDYMIDTNESTTFLNHHFDEIIDLKQRSLQICAEKWLQMNSNKALNIRKEQPEEKILLIHVGKAGGTTVKSILTHHHYPFTHAHLRRIEPLEIFNYEDIIITVREPMGRYFSAFYFQSYQREEHGFNVRHYPDRKDFYDCFPYGMNQYVEMLITPTHPCGRIARSGQLHTKFDTCSYIGGIISSLQAHGRVFIIETEHFVDDINYVLKYSLPNFKRENLLLYNQSTMPVRNDYKKEEVEVPLTDANRIILNGYLHLIGEYDILNEIRSLSLNAFNRTS